MSRVPAHRRCSTALSAGLALVLACGLTLWGASTAPAASSAPSRRHVSSAVHGLSSTPPVPLGSTAGPRRSAAAVARRAAASSPAVAAGTRLPATGYDAATAAVLGMVLLATGLGLRRLTGGRQA